MENALKHAMSSQNPNKIDVNHTESVFKAIIGPDGKIKEQYLGLLEFLKVSLHDIADL